MTGKCHGKQRVSMAFPIKREKALYGKPYKYRFLHEKFEKIKKLKILKKSTCILEKDGVY